MSEFWKPNQKWESVEWCALHFNAPSKEFGRMTYKRLYGIYMTERKRRGYGKEVVCRGGSR